MKARPHAHRARPAARQRGQAMMIVVVILILIIAGAVYTTSTSGTMAIANRQADDTARTMAEVKEALIGWSAARTPVAGSLNRRPGELPCPDNDNSGTDSGSCVAGAIGRVPWKSLGIPEPRDSTGETLWYAIAGPFRNHNMSSAPITSDTQGNLTVYLDSSTTTMTSQAIAVIFAPGPALGTQERGTAVADCSGTPIARNLCAANYLESTGGGNNAQTGGPFIQAQKSDTFNDRVLAITNADLMPVVEQRVAREIRSLLELYRAAVLVYPWADVSNGASDAGQNRGRLPCADPAILPPGTLPQAWGTGGTPSLPNWLSNGCGSNGWTSVIHYAIAPLNAPDISVCLGVFCNTTCIDLTLRVDGACGKRLVLLTPGGATGARVWLGDYFEDGVNNDNSDDTFITPTSRRHNRDRIFTTP